MKPHFALTALLLSLCMLAPAAVCHSGVSLHTYVDFATNSGRYATGRITGPGDLHVTCRSPKAAWRLCGDLCGLNSLSLESGQLILDSATEAGKSIRQQRHPRPAG